MLMYFHTEIRKDCSGVEQCVTYGNPSSISPASSSLYKKAMNESEEASNITLVSRPLLLTRRLGAAEEKENGTRETEGGSRGS